MPAPSIQVETYVIGAIRCGDDGVWRVIQDDSHGVFGITKIETLSDRVRVWHEPIAKVGKADAQIDETFARFGVICGPSVGLDHFDVQFHREGTTGFSRPDYFTKKNGYEWSNVFLEARTPWL